MIEATEPVYHYTSASGLLGLLQTQTLWASEATSLNDIAEIRQGWDFIDEWLKHQIPKSSTALWLKRVADSTRQLHGQAEVFVACASTRRDDANQWRLYADAGRGYAVELDPSAPMSVLSRDVAISRGSVAAKEERRSSQSSGGPVVRGARDLVTVSPWLHVLYDQSIKDRAMHDVLVKARADRHWVQAGPTADEREHRKELWEERASEVLATIAQLVKSPGFSGEDEVRIAATFFGGLGHHLGFRATPFGVVRYAPLAHAGTGSDWAVVLPASSTGVPQERLPIAGVQLAPGLRAESVPTITHLLRRHGHRAARVTTSRVPLR